MVTLNSIIFDDTNCFVLSKIYAISKQENFCPRATVFEKAYTYEISSWRTIWLFSNCLTKCKLAVNEARFLCFWGFFQYKSQYRQENSTITSVNTIKNQTSTYLLPRRSSLVVQKLFSTTLSSFPLFWFFYKWNDNPINIWQFPEQGLICKPTLASALIPSKYPKECFSDCSQQ